MSFYSKNRGKNMNEKLPMVKTNELPEKIKKGMIKTRQSYRK